MRTHSGPKTTKKLSIMTRASKSKGIYKVFSKDASTNRRTTLKCFTKSSIREASLMKSHDLAAHYEILYTRGSP